MYLFIPFDYLHLNSLMVVVVFENPLMLMMDDQYLNYYLMMDLKQFVNVLNVVEMNLFYVVLEKLSFVHLMHVLHPFQVMIHFHLIDDRVVHDDQPLNKYKNIICLNKSTNFKL